MDNESALAGLIKKGWTLIPSVFDEELIENVKANYEKFKKTFIDIQARKGISKETANATHHTHVVCRSMLKFLEQTNTHPILEAYFGGKYILSTMGLSEIPPFGNVYTQKIHRDVRTFTGETHLWVNTLIMLDDSTCENGATFMLEGSHDGSDKPDESHFFANAVRAEGKKGDVLIFDGNIWHSAGQNSTDATRHIVTPIYCKPFIKQQLDYPRAFGPDFGRSISSHLRQILGYNALTPVTLEEFYQKDEDRFYKSDQG